MNLDRAMEASLLPTSFNPSGGLVSKKKNSPGDLSKKRKLLHYEMGNSQLSWPKHKLRDWCKCSDPESSVRGNTEKEKKKNALEVPIDCDLGSNGFDVESEHGSNSFIGGSDDKMPFEVNSNTEELSMKLPKDDEYISENRKNDMEEYEDEEPIDDMMLYSNNVPPFLLATGRWSTGQDARMGTRKPTIDQEFEQYFSALML